MNEVLDSRFVERIERLVLGIEPIDAQRRARIASAVDLVLDGTPSGVELFGSPDPVRSLPDIPRHNSCRHALLYQPDLEGPITIRMYDRFRRFVPRRISYPIPADVHTQSPPPRVRRPALFPGAAYDVSSTATGMRGRVTWNASATNEVPARWVRVEASVGGQVVGRAHGDDRGEFLLMLDCRSGGLAAALPSPLMALVTVFGPPGPITVPANDPLGDLPIETPTPGVDDDVSSGEKLPPSYAATASSSRQVAFELGTLSTRQDKFFFNP